MIVKRVKLARALHCNSNRLSFVMHQSIPVVPSPPPRGNRGVFAHVVSPGSGAFAILSRPRGLGISIFRGESRAFDTRVFERQMSLSGRTRPFFKDWLVHQGLEKLVDVLKGMFSQFYIFLHSL